MGVKRSRRDSLSSSEDPSAPSSREPSADVKLVHLDTASAVGEQPAAMKCWLPPHEPLAFASIQDFDVHYHKTHMNRCSECHNNFPDEYFLHLHIAENHDPFSAAKRDRGEQTYACLVPTCDRLCSTAPKRRMHCIDKHHFPNNYDFFIINHGIDRRSSMLRPAHRRRSSAMNATAPTPGRKGGESSTTAAGESMDLVQDETDEQASHPQEHTPRSVHVKLRGRGGFSHPQAAGRGRGGHDEAARGSTTANMNPLDDLTSSMSALQFVPHSVRVARGRGRGRSA
ncbi:uncharacterized protein EKO05_0007043 [Ascochyta rabiei]|uniref:Metal ion binding n=1 Tax=Didymella rabiei TaxID=5454 RepID=A0A163G6I1_DIDRA|nr:uncharacterized protein EKO05_0007043 [Ascochyta rabiei]KZM24705.1 metal ion binding [Ascochyta rabiei]UPX16653.1 hypothetical protein EKO05_0007043 [Ascochyta rabiei]